MRSPSAFSASYDESVRRTSQGLIGFVAGGLLSGALAFSCSGKTKAKDAGPPPDACTLCVSDMDCANGALCSQLANDSYCAVPCGPNGECPDNTACAQVTTVAGDPVSVCAPAMGDCALAAQDASAPDGSCGTNVPPNMPATCKSCSGNKCQPNGCYGGWWCDTLTNTCHSAPTSCGGNPYDGGPPPTGTVGANGGTLSRLYFAVVGDTRPPTVDDTNGYPTTIITKIYGGVQATGVPFAVSTGDYMFAYTQSGQSQAQLALYLGARSKFTGVLFPALGNHECTGAVASNCGQGNADGLTRNYQDFVNAMLGPIQKPDPWYAIEIDHPNGDWTSKFVFVAANAWSDAQGTWLDGALSKPTTYTFIVRHEPANAGTAPGVTPSETIMAQHPYTLAITGHTHTYFRSGNKEIVIGNGGAPLTGGKNFGYGIFNQRSDGAIQIDMLDYGTGLADPQFHFAVKADGSNAP
jgi:hypothetical protein